MIIQSQHNVIVNNLMNFVTKLTHISIGVILINYNQLSVNSNSFIFLNSKG